MRKLCSSIGQLMVYSILHPYRTGKWGVSSNAVHTQGSTNSTCVGLVTSSKTSAEIAAEEAAREAAAKADAARRRKNLILGIVLGITIPILVIAIAAAAWWRRRKLLSDRDRGIWDGQDTIARSFNPPVVIGVEDHLNEMREVGSIGSPSVSDSKLSPYGSTNVHSSLPLLHSDPLTPTTQEGGGSTTLSSRPSLSSASALASVGGTSSRNGEPTQAQTRKALEARTESARQRGKPSHQTSNPSLRSLPNAPQRNYPGLPPGALPPLTPGGLSPRGMTLSPLDPDVQPDIIIQHRDGGSGVVQELPPPYADRQQRRDRDTPRLPPPPQ